MIPMPSFIKSNALGLEYRFYSLTYSKLSIHFLKCREASQSFPPIAQKNISRVLDFPSAYPAL